MGGRRRQPISVARRYLRFKGLIWLRGEVYLRFKGLVPE